MATFRQRLLTYMYVYKESLRALAALFYNFVANS